MAELAGCVFLLIGMCLWVAATESLEVRVRNSHFAALIVCVTLITGWSVVRVGAQQAQSIFWSDILGLVDASHLLVAIGLAVGGLVVPMALQHNAADMPTVHQLPAVRRPMAGFAASCLILFGDLLLLQTVVPDRLARTNPDLLLPWLIAVVVAGLMAVLYGLFVAGRVNVALVCLSMISSTLIFRPLVAPFLVGGVAVLSTIIGLSVFEIRLRWPGEFRIGVVIWVSALVSVLLSIQNDQTLIRNVAVSIGGALIVSLFGAAIGCCAVYLSRWQRTSVATRLAIAEQAIDHQLAARVQPGLSIGLEMPVVNVGVAESRESHGGLARDIIDVHEVKMPETLHEPQAVEVSDERVAQDFLTRLLVQTRKNRPQPAGKAAHVAYPDNIRRRKIIVPLRTPVVK